MSQKHKELKVRTNYRYIPVQVNLIIKERHYELFLKKGPYYEDNESVLINTMFRLRN